MINTSLASKQFGILTPNTNKALAEVLKTTSVKELDTLSSSVHKDLKSMMNSILKQSIDDTSSNKVLLNLVKNNPTLKNLGSVSTTIKDLLNSIKSDKDTLPIEKDLKKILVDIKDLKGSELKDKLVNSKASIKLEKEDTSVEKMVKNLLSELKKDDTKLKKEVINNGTNVKKEEENKTIKPIKVEEKLKQQLETTPTKTVKVLKEDVSLEKILKKVLTDETKDIPKNTTKKVQLPIEKVIKNFLTEIQNLKGLELKDKLIDLSKFLESNLKNTDTSSTNLKDIVSNDLEELLSQTDKLTEKKETLPIEKTLKKFLLDIKDLKGSELKHKLLNSGVFLESNIKNATKEDIKDISTNDLKVILHKAKEEILTSSHPNQNEILKNIDKLSLQIDNYQLISYLSNGTSLYLPLDWEQLDEGKIELNKVKEDKFFCNIDLKLKDFGDVNLKLVLYDKNQLNLHFHSKSDEFRSLVKNAVSELRSALIGINVTPREIRIFDFKENPQVKTSPYATIDDNLKMGFEVKI